MKLKKLISDCEPYGDIEISSICFDSRKAVKGCLFFCLTGSVDGGDFADEAVSRGAAAIVTKAPLNLSVPQIISTDTRRDLALACAAFYGNPADKLKIIGVTGTNGKTTTTYIIKSILDSWGVKSGVIGSNAVVIGNETYEAKLTTPDPDDLHRIFRQMADAGVEYAVMEVSAHALKLKKLAGVRFAVGAFTNLSRDHLDFFGNMKNYEQTKKSFFESGQIKEAVVNVDDELGRQIALECELPLTTYGCEFPADVFAINLSLSEDGLSYVLNLRDDVAEIKFALPGRFNMYNTLCAAACAGALGVPLKHVVGGIHDVRKVEGRFNVVGTDKCTVIIDFAHTDDGLKNVLTAIREFARGRIITVFGCGGDRDRTKRSIMGKVVSEYSDISVITSDNPRSEDPDSIIDDVAAGIKGKSFVRITDRKEAILYAIKEAKSGDVVLVAGKGAEKYQEIKGEKIPYNDENYILSLIEENKI